MAIDFCISKLWNNRDELLKKFIGGSPDSEIEIDAENLKWTWRSQIEHGSLAETRICRGVVRVTNLTSPEQSH